MRLVEKCSCGASIEVVWEQPKSTYDSRGRSEAERARTELVAFRKRHKTCPSPTFVKR